MLRAVCVCALIEKNIERALVSFFNSLFLRSSIQSLSLLCNENGKTNTNHKIEIRCIIKYKR